MPHGARSQEPVNKEKIRKNQRNPRLKNYEKIRNEEELFDIL